MAKKVGKKIVAVVARPLAKKAIKKAPKKPAVKKAVAKKAIAKKAVVKTVAKKPIVKRTIAKALPVKKTVAKKSITKTSAAKKVPPKKIAAKKAVAKKAVAKKAVVKQAVAKTLAAPAKIVIAPKGLRYEGPNWPLMNVILDSMEDSKAEEILPINVMGRSSMADGMVIASGRANRHVAAIADHLVGKLKAHGQKDIRVEGLDTSDWVLVDAGDIIVHIFRPEVRSFYNLEKLWSEHAPVEQRDSE